MEQHIFPRT